MPSFGTSFLSSRVRRTRAAREGCWSRLAARIPSAWSPIIRRCLLAELHWLMAIALVLMASESRAQEVPSDANCTRLEQLPPGDPLLSPRDYLALVEAAAGEVSRGEAGCGAQVVWAYASQGQFGRADEVARSVTRRFQGIPAVRCFAAFAVLGRESREASITARGAVVACEERPGFRQALADLAQCSVLGGREVNLAVISALRDVALVCRDSGHLQAMLVAVAQEIAPELRVPSLTNLLDRLRNERLPFRLTDAVLIQRTSQWLNANAPVGTAAFVRERTRDLLQRLQAAGERRAEGAPMGLSTLVAARALLGASGRLAGADPAAYGVMIEDLELVQGLGLLAQPEVSETAATMPFAVLAGAPLPSEAQARLRTLRGRIAEHTSPLMCLVRLRLAMASEFRADGEHDCERARRLTSATAEFLRCDGVCALPIDRYVNDLRAASQEGLESARICSTGATLGDEFDRVLDALRQGVCPRVASVEVNAPASAGPRPGVSR